MSDNTTVYQKGDIIFYDAMGVCRVDDVTRFTVDKINYMNYYVLKMIADKSQKAYIPVENHKSVLRPLISIEEANAILADPEDKDPLIIQEAEYVISQAH